jgi:hypothetical protein
MKEEKSITEAQLEEYTKHAFFIMSRTHRTFHFLAFGEKTVEKRCCVVQLSYLIS